MLTNKKYKFGGCANLPGCLNRVFYLAKQIAKVINVLFAQEWQRKCSQNLETLIQ